MKYKKNKLISMIISAIIIVINLWNIMGYQVQAALTGNQEIGVIFAYGGNHGDITLQGGWHKSASNNRFAVWYTKQDRKVMYCLEPGNSRGNDSTADSRNVNYIRDNLNNRFLNGYQIEQFINYILAYGYVGTIDGGATVHNIGTFADPIRENGASNTTQIYEACQILIWETIVGERDSNFNYVAPESGFTPCKAIHTTSGETGDAFDRYYQQIADSVRNYGSIPSFMAPSINDASNMPEVTKSNDGFYYLENSNNCNISDWTFIVVDKNKNQIPGSGVSNLGTGIKVKVPSGVTEAYVYGYNRVCGDGVVAWSSDGSWGPDSPSQDLIQCGFADPVRGYAKLKTDSGMIEVNKISDYGVVSGIRFNVYYRGDLTNENPLSTRSDARYILTNENGYGSISNLPYGWYEVEEIRPEYTRVEISADRYDSYTGNPIVRVDGSNNGIVSLTASNYVNALIRINKTDKVTGETVGFTSFNLYCDFNANGVIDPEDENSCCHVSDDDGDGIIEFNNVGIGSYLIREATTYGYYSLSDEIVSLTISDPEVYEVSYENDALGSVTLTKVDSSNHDLLLTTAEFAVYEDVDRNGVFDSSIDEFVANITDTNEDGIYSLNNLSRGNYLIFETVAPEGYEIDTNVYPFEIVLTNLDVSISNCAMGLFENHQTIYGTEFMSLQSGGEIVEYGEEVILVDNVMYSNVIPGEVYELVLTVVDKETSSIVTSDGEELIVSYRFTSETTSGTVGVPVTINSSELSGRTIVAFEVMYRNGKEVGHHRDINSMSQTLKIPNIGTIATTPDGERRIVVPSEETEFIDNVSYENLIPGREYKVYGVVMDRQTGLIYRNDISTAASLTRFMTSSSDGTAVVEFTINTIGFEGYLVVFEEVYDVETGLLVAVHKDIDYEDQTVEIRATPTPTPSGTPSLTPTPTPGIPSTGESSGQKIKVAVAGSIVVSISAVILINYFYSFRKED